jgi:hypothetical protein
MFTLPVVLSTDFADMPVSALRCFLVAFTSVPLETGLVIPIVCFLDPAGNI